VKQHINENTLIEVALGLLDAQADSRVRDHLEGCPMCRGLFESIKRTLHEIKELAPKVTADIPEVPSVRPDSFRWLRVAAMLVIGFGLGFLASESLQSPSIDVVRQQIISTPPELPAAGFVPCEGVDLTWSQR
jgi:anti-sigma factor RsiW